VNKLQIIDERVLLGKWFQMYGTFEEPLFLAKDVAEWIEHNNATLMVNTVDDDEKKLDYVIDSSGQRRKSIFLTEDGLYEVLMQSRKPIAKSFKKAVKDILKDLRTGRAILIPQTLPEALRLAADLAEKNEMLRIQSEAMKPKVLFADSVAASQDCILIRELAKYLKQNDVNTGEKRLFSWLRENGYLIKGGEDYNTPTQRALDMRLFKVKKTAVTKPNGDILTGTTTMVTGKGQQYFVDKFLKMEIIS
jgi:Uncharacterized phage-encoded protein